MHAISDPRLHIIALNAQCDASIEKAKEEVAAVVGDQGLNLLVNNAGVLVHYPPDVPNRKLVMETLEINTAAPLLISQVRLDWFQ